MTAVLITASDAKVFMGVTSTGDDTLIQGIVDSVESLLQRQCGRHNRPFATAATGRVEVLDGTGTPLLMVDYPISAITTIKIGRDFTDPDETLTATDVDEIAFATGKRALWRTDGGIWRSKGGGNRAVELGTGSWAYANGEPRIIQITYNHDADQPDDAKLAVKRAVAAVYRQRGSEDATSETMPNSYTRTIAQVTESDPIWQLAVEAQAEPVGV